MSCIKQMFHIIPKPLAFSSLVRNIQVILRNHDLPLTITCCHILHSIMNHITSNSQNTHTIIWFLKSMVLLLFTHSLVTIHSFTKCADNGWENWEDCDNVCLQSTEILEEQPQFYIYIFFFILEILQSVSTCHNKFLRNCFNKSFFPMVYWLHYGGT